MNKQGKTSKDVNTNIEFNYRTITNLNYTRTWIGIKIEIIEIICNYIVEINYYILYVMNYISYSTKSVELLWNMSKENPFVEYVPFYPIQAFVSFLDIKGS